jgi:hypothetical protein
MEKHDEQEITSLLTTIRAKRDLSSFGNSNQMKNGNFRGNHRVKTS